MSEIHNQREMEQLQSEIARLEHEKRSAALDWMTAARQYEDEIERLRAALDILQTAMTAKKPIPMPFKKAINEARAALGGDNG